MGEEDDETGGKEGTENEVEGRGRQEDRGGRDDVGKGGQGRRDLART